MATLVVITPVTRGERAVPAVRSTLASTGFERVIVIVSGNSCLDAGFRSSIQRLSPDVYVAAPLRGERRLPGGARNDGLDYAVQHFPEMDFVLFADDDIVVPPNYAAELRAYLARHPNAVAVIGRMESRPRNLATAIIDYSNFWWLQGKHDLTELDWMISAATMFSAKDLGTLRFDESLRVGEDVRFFLELRRRCGNRQLAVYAGASCEHYHSRTTLWEMIRYQYTNGREHRAWHEVVGFAGTLRRVASLMRATIRLNRSELLRRPLVLGGVLLSFLVCELGIYAGRRRATAS